MAVQLVPHVGRAEQHVGAVIEHVGIVGRKHDGRGPLEAVLQLRRAPAHGIVGPGIHVLQLAAGLVVARDQAVVGAGEDDVGIGRIGNNEAAFAAADRVPVLAIDRATIAAAGDGDGGIVLLRAVDVVAETVVGGNVVELRRRLVI